MASGIEIVTEAEWPIARGGRNYRTDKHQDLYDALNVLRRNPEAIVKVRGGEAKRSVACEYARRYKLAIESRVKKEADGSYVFIRLQRLARLRNLEYDKKMPAETIQHVERLIAASATVGKR